MKRIAYLILAHNDPDHLYRLVTALGLNCDIYIHIDKKSALPDFNCVTLVDNVTILEERYTVSWAGISMIAAQMALIKAALAHQGDYTHLVFLSGSCYPIKPPDDILATLTDQPQREFIRFIDMRESPEHYMRQITQKWFREPLIQSRVKFLSLLDKSIRRALEKMRLRNDWETAYVPYYGSQWCALTVACCQFLLKTLEERPSFRQMNRFTFAPDEHFLHTLVGNSPFMARADGIQPFKGRGVWRLANLHVVDQTLQKWFTIRDFDQIAASDKFFVRKVRTADGADLLNRIDKEILSNEHYIGAASA